MGAPLWFPFSSGSQGLTTGQLEGGWHCRPLAPGDLCVLVLFPERKQATRAPVCQSREAPEVSSLLCLPLCRVLGTKMN